MRSGDRLRPGEESGIEGGAELPAYTQEVIDAALLRLPALERGIFIAHRIDGQSYAEIAAARGISVRRVERAIARALTQLRHLLADMEREDNRC